MNISSHSLSQSVESVKAPLYRYRDIWASESGATNRNTAEWSFGNGATGFIGLPIDNGWEVEAMYFQSDVFAANASIQVDLMNYSTASDDISNTLASISLADATDGGGTVDHAYKYVSFPNPPQIITSNGTTVIGFITRGESGAISDARVGAILRKKVGDYVTDIN